MIETIDKLGGNQDLTYPVGLITADEVIFTGNNFFVNNSNYLFSVPFWTGSPTHFNNDDACYFFDAESSLAMLFVSAELGVRPVIFLKPDTLKYGTGEANNPFRITE